MFPERNEFRTVVVMQMAIAAAHMRRAPNRRDRASHGPMRPVPVVTAMAVMMVPPNGHQAGAVMNRLVAISRADVARMRGRP